MKWVLPAYAGMIPFVRVPEHDNRGAPRVCGDDPLYYVTKG